MDDRDSIFCSGSDFCSLLPLSAGSGAHPASSYSVGAFPEGGKWPDVKLITRLHLALRLKNGWTYTSTPQYVFMVW